MRRRLPQSQTRSPALVEIEYDLITVRREVGVDRLIRELLDVIVDDKLTTTDHASVSSF
jgi:hypothetical protein